MRDERIEKVREKGEEAEEEKGVEGGGLEFYRNHSLYNLAISYLIPLSPSLSLA